MFDLTGKKALITGSSQGIGLASARALAEAGAGALALALAVGGVDGRDLDAEDLFDGDLDLGLVGVRGDEERVDVLLHEAVRLFRNDRCEDDVAWVGDGSH